MATAPVPLMGRLSSVKRASPGCGSPLISSASGNNKKPRTQEISPISILHTIFGESDLVVATNISADFFQKPTEQEIEAYDVEIVRAIRMGDLGALKRLHVDGKDLNASNQFGESLLHMACRRGNVSIVSYMLREAHVRVNHRDDFGRNILHDACWTSSPNLDIMDELLEFVNPLLMLSEDARGSTPFDYCRRDHWGEWIKYLSDRKEKIQARIEQIEGQKN